MGWAEKSDLALKAQCLHYCHRPISPSKLCPVSELSLYHDTRAPGPLSHAQTYVARSSIVHSRRWTRLYWEADWQPVFVLCPHQAFTLWDRNYFSLPQNGRFLIWLLLSSRVTQGVQMLCTQLPPIVVPHQHVVSVPRPLMEEEGPETIGEKCAI